MQEILQSVWYNLWISQVKTDRIHTIEAIIMGNAVSHQFQLKFLFTLSYILFYFIIKIFLLVKFLAN